MSCQSRVPSEKKKIVCASAYNCLHTTYSVSVRVGCRAWLLRVCDVFVWVGLTNHQLYSFATVSRSFGGLDVDWRCKPEGSVSRIECRKLRAGPQTMWVMSCVLILFFLLFLPSIYCCTVLGSPCWVNLVLSICSCLFQAIDQLDVLARFRIPLRVPTTLNF